MKRMFTLLATAAMAATSAWATADVTWSLGGADNYEPAAGVWVGTSEGGEQITSGHLYLCFTPAGEDSQLENWITQLTSHSSNSGLDCAGVDAMTAFLAANSQWNGYNAGNPNFSANIYSGTGGAFGTSISPRYEYPAPVTIDGIDANNAYDVVALIFDTQEITADSKYVVIKGYGKADFCTEGSDPGRLEFGFYSDWYDDIDNGWFAPNVAVDGWHSVAACNVITFDANEGEGTMESQTIEGSGTLTANTLTREGYTFAGWNTAADGKGTAYTDEQAITVTAETKGEVTLYAQWKEAVPTALNVNGNEKASKAIKTVENGKIVIIKEGVKRDLMGRKL